MSCQHNSNAEVRRRARNVGGRFEARRPTRTRVLGPHPLRAGLGSGAAHDPRRLEDNNIHGRRLNSVPSAMHLLVDSLSI
ncbi:hypothetical protein EVAR_69987_1 [Eumeta japonica]|uniref:Uncharacterized protein n=1 Tax=Eumeta variegata TaxID=151549 RepID=A0A4C1ZAY7_EUMVA|nr:hypothetical protein EVAR_69987_1 [Eumeta japonica]